MNSNANEMQNYRLIGILSVATLLLVTPLVAMQFSTEVDWDTTDFLVAGILLFGTGLLCELVLRNVKKTMHRLILCGIVLVALFLIWAELAVGVFGTPLAGS